MNNAKMWLVVSPSVGVPVFLGAVAVGSFAVHVAVLSSTSWVDDFLSGKPLGGGDEMAAVQTLDSVTPAQALTVTPRADGLQEVLVRLPDGTTATAILQPDQVMAAASTRYVPPSE